jgi:hypothetical protein
MSQALGVSLRGVHRSRKVGMGSTVPGMACMPYKNLTKPDGMILRRTLSRFLPAWVCAGSATHATRVELPKNFDASTSEQRIYSWSVFLVHWHLPACTQSKQDNPPGLPCPRDTSGAAPVPCCLIVDYHAVPLPQPPPTITPETNLPAKLPLLKDLHIPSSKTHYNNISPPLPSLLLRILGLDPSCLLSWKHASSCNSLALTACTMQNMNKTLTDGNPEGCKGLAGPISTFPSITHAPFHTPLHHACTLPHPPPSGMHPSTSCTHLSVMST